MAAKGKASKKKGKKSEFGYKIYFTERPKNRVMCWDPDSDDLTVVAGEPADGAKDQLLEEPYGLALAHDGSLLVTDKHHNRICRIRGERLEPMATRDASGSRARLKERYRDMPATPTSMWPMPDGTLLCTYCDDGTIYRIQRDGSLELFLGKPRDGTFAISGCRAVVPPEDVPGTPVVFPTDIVARDDGTVFFIERGYEVVREYHPQRGLRSISATDRRKQWSMRGTVPDSIPLAEFQPVYPTSLALDSEGRLFIADSGVRCVLRINEDKTASCVMRSPKPEKPVGGGPAGITFGPDGVLWVLDTSHGTLQGLSSSGGDGWTEVASTEVLPPGDESGNSKIGGVGIVCVG